MPGKRCTRCKELKLPEEFDVKHSARDGLSSHCKSCRREALRAHYRNNKEVYFAKSKNHTKKMRRVVQRIKESPCVDCGGKFPPDCMDLDHVRGEKVLAVSALVGLGKSLEKVLAEAAKCDIVCANCHRIRTMKRRERRRNPTP